MSIIGNITKADIAAAKEFKYTNGKPIYSPVIEVLRSYEQHIKTVCAKYKSLSGDQQSNYLFEGLGEIADAFEGIKENFTLKPLEIVAITSEMTRLFGSTFNRRREGIAIATYGLQAVDKAIWKGFVRDWYTEEKINDGYSVDKEGLKKFCEKIADVSKSVGILDSYRCGIEGGEDAANDIADKARQGDQEAGKQIKKIKQHLKEHNDPLFRYIIDGFVTAYILLDNEIETRLETSET